MESNGDLKSSKRRSNNFEAREVSEVMADVDEAVEKNDVEVGEDLSGPNFSGIDRFYDLELTESAEGKTCDQGENAVDASISTLTRRTDRECFQPPSNRVVD